MFYERPVEYKPCGDMDKDLKLLTEKVIGVIEDKIRHFPEQWFMFREFWLPDANKV
jgi:lauroyl/myristoyl acyltransferase